MEFGASCVYIQVVVEMVLPFDDLIDYSKFYQCCSPPPNPPILECVSAGYNSLKLRWADSTTTQESLAYSLEMENKNGRCRPPYHPF